jgi:hypothetical protein
METKSLVDLISAGEFIVSGVFEILDNRKLRSQIADYFNEHYKVYHYEEELKFNVEPLDCHYDYENPTSGLKVTHLISIALARKIIDLKKIRTKFHRQWCGDLALCDTFDVANELSHFTNIWDHRVGRFFGDKLGPTRVFLEQRHIDLKNIARGYSVTQALQTNLVNELQPLSKVSSYCLSEIILKDEGIDIKPQFADVKGPGFRLKFEYTLHPPDSDVNWDKGHIPAP